GRTFAAALLFDDLHQDDLATLDHLLDLVGADVPAGAPRAPLQGGPRANPPPRRPRRPRGPGTPRGPPQSLDTAAALPALLGFPVSNAGLRGGGLGLSALGAQCRLRRSLRCIELVAILELAPGGLAVRGGRLEIGAALAVGAALARLRAGLRLRLGF